MKPNAPITPTLGQRTWVHPLTWLSIALPILRHVRLHRNVRVCATKINKDTAPMNFPDAWAHSQREPLRHVQRAIATRDGVSPFPFPQHCAQHRTNNRLFFNFRNQCVHVCAQCSAKNKHIVHIQWQTLPLIAIHICTILNVYLHMWIKTKRCVQCDSAYMWIRKKHEKHSYVFTYTYVYISVYTLSYTVHIHIYTDVMWTRCVHMGSNGKACKRLVPIRPNNLQSHSTWDKEATKTNANLWLL